MSQTLYENLKPVIASTVDSVTILSASVQVDSKVIAVNAFKRAI